MDSVLSQLVERLFQPIALGTLTLYPTAILSHQAGFSSEPMVAGQVPEFLSDPMTKAIIFAMAAFLVGQFASVVGQSIFTRLFTRIVKPDKSFFAKVKEADDPFIEKRYDHIRYQVDMLCGGIGIGLVVASLTVILFWLSETGEIPWAVVFGFMGVSILSWGAAHFHAREFWKHLKEAS
ncbi:hypothetical protein [Phaeobacter sp. 22II1-1F12B]|uniref:hypothetical protein n=1 Tax=Phaeobacter sp. 22II1-1F12B TaxID=1317111 RepID=UPI000B526434|nr:hypothetical protein [Phaeobacter sp. 22II1-1F12B]OWU79029.1 hypothetical protein ATO1_13140 [Phaeobacter sp. 22II1-1F12B]